MADAVIPTASESCKTCRFWLFQTLQPGFRTQTSKDIPDIEHGVCRYRPPVPYAYEDHYGSHWPSVIAIDWCGKYEEAKA
jgi:hypothetical protein